MTNPVDFFTALSEIFGNITDSDWDRYPLIRTTKTEDRIKIHKALRIEVYKRDHFQCVFCGSPSPLQLDHIEPWSALGTDDFDNLRTLCKQCNDDRSNYKNPLADQSRRFPGGFECIHCSYQTITGEVVQPIYCRICCQNAAGIPSTDLTVYQQKIDAMHHYEGTSDLFYDELRQWLHRAYLLLAQYKVA